MELHRHSCVLPSNALALVEHDTSIPNRVLQERSVNRRHDYTDPSSQWKRSSSPADNVYSGRLGSYFTGNLGPPFNGEKSDAHIEFELKKVMGILRRCEKYQKYRDRQPQTKQDREQKWSDQMEEAFFRGLIRWPPMGRRKHMLDGQLRGRNELVADSIERDTGVPRSRKQVSSHIQVLKNILQDCPQILVYMSTADLSGRRNRHGASHYGHQRNRHASSKYDQSASSAYPGFRGLPSAVALAKIQKGQEDAPYTVADFGIFVEAGPQKKRVHRFTELVSSSRQTDINVCDTTSWHKQFPEFNFHRTDELKSRNVVVCDASIKVMTMERPAGADLSIAFDLRSKINLCMYESLECSTRFFDNGKGLDQYDEDDRKVKQTTTAAEYYGGHYAEQDGLLRVKFGAGFWAYQMHKMSNILRKAEEQEQSTRVKYETIVRKELQYMTAAQDIYGTNDGEKKCFLTILWRFSQTRSSHESGRMTWRVVNFGLPRERRLIKTEELEKEVVPVTASSSSALVSIPTSTASSIYPSLPLDFTHQPFTHHQPPPLDLDSLALETMTSDFSNPNSVTAPSLATDYSQSHSIPSLSHSQDFAGTQSQSYHDAANEFDFNGGHITLSVSGCLEPAINLGAYETYGTHSHAQTLHGLPSIAGLDQDMHASSHGGGHYHPNSYSDIALGVSMANPNCYATNPSWHHPSLISHLENQAEQYSDLLMQTSSHPDSGGNVVGHGVLDGHMGGGMWKLQSAFGEDTGVGAMVGLGDGRKDSLVGKGVDLGVLDWGERERREERYRPY